MFNVNFSKIVRRLIPSYYYNNWLKEWLQAKSKPLINLHNKLLIYRDTTIYDLSHNSQIIYLEKLLNDKYDDVLRRIYITNTADVDTIFLYNDVEEKPPLYLYNNHQMATAYLVGEFAAEGNTIYKCTANNTGYLPSANFDKWEFYKTITFLKNKIEPSSSFDFIVNVPVLLSYDAVAMKALINKYKLADKRYKIETF